MYEVSENRGSAEQHATNVHFPLAEVRGKDGR